MLIIKILKYMPTWEILLEENDDDNALKVIKSGRELLKQMLI